MSKWWHTSALGMHKEGTSWRKIAKQLGVPRSTVSDFLRSQKAVVMKANGAKILFVDVETAPSLYYGFGRYDQNFSQAHVEREGYVLSYSYAWGHEGKVDGYVLSSEDALEQDDFVLANDLFMLLDEADIVVGHNLKKFDIKKINALLVKHGFPPPSPYKMIDTLLMARSKFSFPSNKLGDLAIYLGLPYKIDTGGIQLWVDCVKGKEEALAKMLEYNKGDVVTLQALYQRLQAWNSTTPNMAHYYNDNVVRCTKCGSDDLVDTGKLTHTAVNSYYTYRCNCCGGISRSRSVATDKAKRATILANVV